MLDTGPPRIQCKRNRVLELGAPAFLPCGGCRVFGKLRTSASQVALKQGAPEDDPGKINCQRFGVAGIVPPFNAASAEAYETSSVVHPSRRGKDRAVLSQ